MYKRESGMAERALSILVLAVTLIVVASGCGTEEPTEAGSDQADLPTIVATTNILGDVVAEMVGEQANVVTIMPVGADPHDFQPSAQQVDQLLNADALIINGGGFEEGLLDVIDSAEQAGVPTFRSLEAVSTINFDDEGHDDEGHDDDGDDEHSDDEHGDDEHGHDGVDPHFFTDPARMADAVNGIESFLIDEVAGLNADLLADSVATYEGELEALDAEVSELVAEVPVEDRILVMNHDVFSYFAERYDFEFVGAAIPTGTTVGSASANDLANLADTIEAEGVPAIFTETSSSSELVDTLAAEVGNDVAVVELYAESLGQPDSEAATYLDMMRTNATRIVDALG